jgi:hypothetical protein
VDSCVMGSKHHAYSQPENEADRAYPFVCYPTGHPEQARTFMCTPWHAKQAECFLQTIRINGHQFLLNVHGDGLLAFMLKASADVEWSMETAANSGVCSERE